MGYPGRQNIYEATIRRMVLEALELQETEHRRLHGEDTDGQLLAYLRSCAHRLGHTPWPGEITGGSLIQERFGSWEQALALAKLPVPKAPNQIRTFARFREETERQKEVYRHRKAEKKELAMKRHAGQSGKGSSG